MKLVYALPLLLVLVVGFVGYAEAYEGEIRVDTDMSQYIQGDIVTVEIMLIGDRNVISVSDGVAVFGDELEGIPDETIPIEISIRERGNEKNIISEKIFPQWVFDGQTYPSDPFWTTEYSIDTMNDELASNMPYEIIVKYDDRTVSGQFDFNSPIAEQSIQAGQLLANTEQQPREIPSWIRDLFIFFANGEISDDELLNAIEYLISVDLIKIK